MSANLDIYRRTDISKPSAGAVARPAAQPVAPAQPQRTVGDIEYSVPVRPWSDGIAAAGLNGLRRRGIADSTVLFGAREASEAFVVTTEPGREDANGLYLITITPQGTKLRTYANGPAKRTRLKLRSLPYRHAGPANASAAAAAAAVAQATDRASRTNTAYLPQSTPDSLLALLDFATRDRWSESQRQEGQRETIDTILGFAVDDRHAIAYRIQRSAHPYGNVDQALSQARWTGYAWTWTWTQPATALAAISK